MTTPNIAVSPFFRRIALCLLTLSPMATSLATPFFTAAPAHAQPKGVGAWKPIEDGAGLFTPAAIERSNEGVAEIKRKFGKDLFIETLHAPPRPKTLDVKDTAAVGRFFDDFAERRFSEKHVDGVYVMIVDNPKTLRVVVGNQTEKKLFTIADRNELSANIRAKLSAGDKDGALATAVSTTQSAFARHAEPRNEKRGQVAPAAAIDHGRARPSAGSGLGSILGIVAILVVVGLVIFVIRSLFSGGMGGAGAGGGFMSSLLGGLFGAAAGMWLYNNFFGGGTSSAWGADSSPTYGKDDVAPPDSSAGNVGGGDYDDSSNAGGDWGDAGGGDWGGGGGDW